MTMTAEDTDKLARAKSQGQAQFDSIKEMVEALTNAWPVAANALGWEQGGDNGGFIFHKLTWGSWKAAASWSGNEDQEPNGKNDHPAIYDTWEDCCNGEDIDVNAACDEARRAIEEDALSVEVRSDWYSPTASHPETEPYEYNILLCTGGPAVRIIGTLSEHGEPKTARLEVQDWFTPWTAFRPLVSPDNYDSEPILLAYASCFYFGE